MKYYVILLLIIIGLSVYSVKTIQNKNKEISALSLNNKAYIAELDDTKQNNRQYKFTIDQLSYFNDSINRKIIEVTKELNIKNNKLKELIYVEQELKTTDTIITVDTIFVPNINIDTLIGDYWYNIRLQMNYPNNIIITPTFNSELYIITNTNKETINPPKKLFFLRWFQKKHTIVEINIVDSNKYNTIKKQRFIEIIK